MQLAQKHLPRKNWVKPVLYLILFCLILSCKPFLYRQGVGLVFDYEVAAKRVQSASNWLATQVSTTNQKPTVVYRGQK